MRARTPTVGPLCIAYIRRRLDVRRGCVQYCCRRRVRSKKREHTCQRGKPVRAADTSSEEDFGSSLPSPPPIPNTDASLATANSIRHTHTYTLFIMYARTSLRPPLLNVHTASYFFSHFFLSFTIPFCWRYGRVRTINTTTTPPSPHVRSRGTRRRKN